MKFLFKNWFLALGVDSENRSPRRQSTERRRKGEVEEKGIGDRKESERVQRKGKRERQ